MSAHGSDGCTRFGGRLDRAPDQIDADEGPRSIVNDDQIGARGDAGERVGDRLLAARAPFDHLEARVRAAEKVGQRRQKIGRQRHDDVVHKGTTDERVDAALQDRPAGQHQQLLRAIAAEARAAAARGDDG